MSEAAYAAALVEFQKSLPRIGKGQTATVQTKAGGSYSYSFADLADITAVVVPLLTAHGLAWTAKPVVGDHGFVLECALVHVDGHREAGSYPLPDPSKSTPQEIGSAITYARRYALTSLTGIAPGGEDDDGQHATKGQAARRDGRQVAWDRVAGLARGMAWSPERVAEDYAEWARGLMIADADEGELNAYADYLDEERKRGNRDHAQLVAAATNTTQAGKGRKDSPDAGRVERSQDANDPEFAGTP